MLPLAAPVGIPLSSSMNSVRIAIAGAGSMARTRGKAFLDTGRAHICAVASLHADTAQTCAEELDCKRSFDDYRRLAEVEADAILIETPHRAQDEIALWALETGFDLLIGGCLASCTTAGEQIVALAAREGCVVEAGYQRRYDPAWEEIRRLLQQGDLGAPVVAITMALWRGDPQSWYYDQQASGGMPLTHMSYCYLNAIRWILGRPVSVSALASRRPDVDASHVTEESCAALVSFDSGAFASATASFIGPTGMDDAAPRFVCTDGGVLAGGPAPAGHDALTVSRAERSEVVTFANQPSPFVRQADAFLDAVADRRPARNPPEDALIDLQVAEAITEASRETRVVHLE